MYLCLDTPGRNGKTPYCVLKGGRGVGVISPVRAHNNDTVLDQRARNAASIGLKDDGLELCTCELWVARSPKLGRNSFCGENVCHMLQLGLDMLLRAFAVGGSFTVAIVQLQLALELRINSFLHVYLRCMVHNAKL